MNNYTKVSDNLVAKYGIKVAYVYAKLNYRMKLSKRSKKFFDNDYFVIYKIKDLAHDCHLGRSSIINIMNKLENTHLIHRVHTMFANKIYLPKSDNTNAMSKNQPIESPKSKLSEQQKSNNQNSNNYVSVHRFNVSQTHRYPKETKVIKKYGEQLYRYAVATFHKENDTHLATIHSPYHFVVGILRRWARKGIKTVNEAMQSERDGRAKYPDDNGPEIPIFKII